MKGIIYIDPVRCLACKSCQLRCALEHSKSKDLGKAICEEPLPKSRIKLEQAVELAIPLQCRHCEDAPCVEVCPSKALERLGPQSPVIINDQLCVGCQSCILVCPFGVIYMSKDGKVVTKCDLCFERLNRGEEPACVGACPTGALQFKPIEEQAKQESKDYLVKFKKEEGIL